jgi:ribosomal protein S17
MPKTVTVLSEYQERHPLYQKAFLRSKKYLVHDEIGLQEGDMVEIVKVRPISKNKHWQAVKVVGRDIEAIVTEELKEEAAEAIAEVMPVVAEPEVVIEAVDEVIAEKKPRKTKGAK